MKGLSSSSTRRLLHDDADRADFDSSFDLTTHTASSETVVDTRAVFLRVGDRDCDVSNLYSPLPPPRSPRIKSSKNSPYSSLSSTRRRRIRDLSELKACSVRRNSDLCAEDMQLCILGLNLEDDRTMTMTPSDASSFRSNGRTVCPVSNNSVNKQRSAVYGSSNNNSTHCQCSLQQHLQKPGRSDSLVKDPSCSASTFTRSTLSTTQSSSCSSHVDYSATSATSAPYHHHHRVIPAASSLKPPPPPAATSPPTPRQPAAYTRFPQPTSAPAFPLVEIEVSPGIFLPLRGSQETMQAVESCRAAEVHCLACRALLLCVPDCELVLCPDCRILSPVVDTTTTTAQERMCHSMSAVSPYWDDEREDERPIMVPWRRGVGLGLNINSLAS